MSLRQLTSTHTVYVHPLTDTQDAMLGHVEAVGSRLSTKKCRMVPITVAEDGKYNEPALHKRYRALFSDNPNLTLSRVIVWSSEVYRIRSIKNASGMSWMWIVDLEHDPRLELSA